MNYIKKMCILRQVRQGFSGDGKTLSGLIKIEQYGKNLAIEVSIINFAPLVSGEYYCLISDGNGKTEMLSLRGKSLFNILSDLDISGGFCGIICYVKTEVIPIAYGINGNKSYDWKAILNATLPPVFPRKSEKISRETAQSIGAFTVNPQPTKNNAVSAPAALASDAPPPPLPPELPQPPPEPSSEPLPPQEDSTPPTHGDGITAKKDYDDETVATENYYEEKNDERKLLQKTSEDAHTQSAAQEQEPKTRADASENVDASGILHPIKTDPDGYYLAVKAEIDGLFRKYPRDKTLDGAFSCSEWVRIQGTAKAPQYLVGVLREDGRARYICYALATEDKSAPPDEIKNVCSFVPTSPYTDSGFFVIFQSAATGECIRPERA